MNQQINLYQPIFRKQKKVFSSVAILQVSLIALVLFSLTSGYSYVKLRQLQDQEAAVERNLAGLRGQVVKMVEQSRDDTTIRLLETEINRMKRELEQKKSVASMLAQGSFENTSGFAGHFEALARQHVNGAWLSLIEIENGGASLNLNGTTFSAELVPVYLQRLLQEEIFNRTTFNVLGLERSEENPEEIQFQVGTATEGNPDGSS